MSPVDDSRASRAERKRAYKEAVAPMGIYAIRNLVNGKVFVGHSLNLPAMFNRIRFEFAQRMHRVPELQADWERLGEAAFSFEVLDQLKPLDEPGPTPPVEELKVLEEMWLERLKPYGDAGYNTPPRP
ncbi:GIY-YIG nuclease family protein [Corallococcus sp. bb12-1]|uniref:GIY-YIG nuclease family protein n=1 Tax=Corallococcus sp. bb12-1 TaxID=2996784 RepID=UPI002270CDC9|nr:GIY-YIG nuclease family protein [Corallococcus sp. bb12-1]MCY1045996.1 GIY-YIG nuclease family protein [Corallococcus sp. bb12-1]